MIGLGRIGLPVAKQLAAQGHCVIGVSRSTPTDLAFCNPDVSCPIMTIYIRKIYILLPVMRALVIAQLRVNGQAKSTKSAYCRSDTLSLQGYRDSYYAIAEHVVRWVTICQTSKRVVFISSTGVYGQNAGEVIDITTLCSRQQAPLLSDFADWAVVAAALWEIRASSFVQVGFMGGHDCVYWPWQHS